MLYGPCRRADSRLSCLTIITSFSRNPCRAPSEFPAMASSPTTEIVSPELRKRRLDEVAQAASVDTSRAMALALKAREDGAVDALVHHLVGLHHKNAGRLDEAVAELGLGLALEPENPRIMITVGFCLLEAGRRREAAQVFGVAVKLDPNSADASCGYGWAAESLGALDSAESGFNRALALNPRHADALAGLSGLAARRREWDAARRYAEQAAALDPNQTDALMNLARIEIGVSDFVAAEKLLREIIDRPALKPIARANARIMLGDALDGSKRYREAFDAYAQGKSELREYHAGTFGRPDSGSALDAVSEILTEFQESPAEGWSKAPPSAARPVYRGHAFLMGFPRSGTTLLEQVLATHPDVVTLAERPILLDAEAEFLTRDGGVKQLSAIPSEALEPFRKAYWRRAAEYGIDPTGKVFIDKHPLNTIRLPLINKVFPDGKIIFALRDPRDVVLSCFRRSFNMNASMYQFDTLENTARYYAKVMNAAAIYFDKLPLDVFRLRYEDLVTDFEATAGALCDFLGVDRTDALKDFADTARSRRIATPSSAQVGRGLYDEGMNQWPRYAFALKPALPILAPWVERFGYEPS